jgi:transposase InsO family protein
VVALKEVKATDVVKFFRNQILYRYGTPRRIISDNGTAFKNAKIDALTNQYNIDWRYSSAYNPRANGLAEAFNKTLSKILWKTVYKNYKNWHKKLHEALWANRSIRPQFVQFVNQRFKKNVNVSTRMLWSGNDKREEHAIFFHYHPGR